MRLAGWGRSIAFLAYLSGERQSMEWVVDYVKFDMTRVWPDGRLMYL